MVERLLLSVTLFAASCGGAPVEEEPAELEQPPAHVFHRSDMVSFGRTPWNSDDLSHVAALADDFSNFAPAAERVIAHAQQRAHDERPIYLANIHTWIYTADAGYRARIEALAAKVHAATRRTILFYFEEENASHLPTPVQEAHAPALRRLAQHAVLLCATYANGTMSHDEEIAAVMHWREWYHDRLGVPMESMWIDVDLSQTPYAGFYYGSRGDLAQFDRVVGWTLRSAFAHGFGGFHTIGNVGGKYGTKRAADSTYQALDEAWKKLVAEHPHRTFEGI